MAFVIFRFLYWRNLFPSGMNFGKYSVQNDVCPFGYLTRVRLIKVDTDKAPFLVSYWLVGGGGGSRVGFGWVGAAQASKCVWSPV